MSKQFLKGPNVDIHLENMSGKTAAQRRQYTRRRCSRLREESNCVQLGIHDAD
jgi:hypothetical protein